MAPSDTVSGGVAQHADFRLQVVAESIRLFAQNGYESTTVEQIATAAGISRRTFFRQFGSKEDVIFADHEALLDEVAAQLAADTGDPWRAACTAAELVFTHFLATRELAVGRFRVVQEVPALRERELVTTYRYQRLFEEHLRSRLPDESRAHIVAYAAAITAAHNYLLRAMIRGEETVTLERLRAELDALRVALGAGAGGQGAASESVVESGTVGQEPNRGEREITVVTYPAGTSPEEVAARVGEQLRAPASDR